MNDIGEDTHRSDYDTVEDAHQAIDKGLTYGNTFCLA